VTEARVYGVAVPGAEGRAGMAALSTEDGFSLAALEARVAAALPPYARPLFLRLCAGMDMTETFKATKQALRRDGYDPAVVADRLYVYDPASGAYATLDTAVFADIAAGARRL
jgi:fatty-acyl-CoA synthase